jgi:hypothetical protein
MKSGAFGSTTGVDPRAQQLPTPNGRDTPMAAMKPRTGDGPLEVTKEGRGIVLRMPLEGGGRLVVEMTPDEVRALGEAIDNCEGLK